MKSLPWVTLPLIAASAVFGDQLFQRESARQMESSLADVRQDLAPARGAGPAAGPVQAPLFPRLFDPCPRFGEEGRDAPDPELIDALREQVGHLDDCFQKVGVEYKTGRLSARDYRQVGCELAIAKAELAWAEDDLKAARTALEEALVHANHEIRAWGALEAQGLPVREGALDRSVSARRRRVAVLIALACVRARWAPHPVGTPPKGEPEPTPKPGGAGRDGAVDPALDEIKALGDLVDALDDCFKKVKVEYEHGMLRPADYRQAGCALAIAKAELAWAEDDLKAARTALEEAQVHANHEIEAWDAAIAEGLPVREAALDRHVSALSRRVTVVIALACVRAHRALQPVETPPKGEPEPKPKPGGAGRDGAVGPASDVIKALGELVDALDDCHKRVEAEFQRGRCAAHDFARVGYELNAAKAELAWAQGDRQAAARGLKEALGRAEAEISSWQEREAQGLPFRRAGVLDRRIAAVHRRVEAVRAAARMRRSLAPQ